MYTWQPTSNYSDLDYTFQIIPLLFLFNLLQFTGHDHYGYDNATTWKSDYDYA